MTTVCITDAVRRARGHGTGDDGAMAVASAMVLERLAPTIR